MHNTRRRLFTILLGMILLLVLGCQAISLPGAQSPTASPSTTAPHLPPTEVEQTKTVPPEQPTSPPGAPTTSPPPTQVDQPDAIYPPAFADYPAVSFQVPEAAFQGYTLPFDLSRLANPVPLEQDLSPTQRETLEANGFVVVEPDPGHFQEFYQVYESYRYDQTYAPFVTLDSVFHVYHLLFDKMLRDLETEAFIPTLESLTSSMLASSLDQVQQLQGQPLEEQALRNAAFFGVAARLLELPDSIPPNVASLVDAEVGLIEAHQGPFASPVWDRPDLPPEKKLIEDYSQYIPRGHYTRSEPLQRYFKTMMWYGRLTFRGRDSFETQRALLLIQALRSCTTSDGSACTALWERIYEPTVFIVGKSDDLSYHEYGRLSDTIFGSAPDLLAFAHEEDLARYIEAIKTLPPPQVNSMWVWIWEDKTDATRGFRFMGQRFTLDAYVFGQLIFRNVGDLSNPRMLPKGLDFFAAMGSDEALSILDDMGETQYANYPERMEKVRREIAALELDSWTQNLYWSWLYAFQPVIDPKDDRFPEFMRTQAWTRKDLNTSLGSWTELKHDTILYAKQVMAEMGGGPGEEPPHGYVEPNPEAFARLIALTRMTYQGLDERGILSDLTRGNLENLEDLLVFLQAISEKELAGEPVSTQEYERLLYYGGEIEALTLASADREAEGPEYRDLSDQKAALIADVATGADPTGSLVALEEAIGQPFEIYVVLPDQPWRVGVGAVFSYYEFVVPVEDRMTDEAWQAQVESGTTPHLPEWTQMFIAP